MVTSRKCYVLKGLGPSVLCREWLRSIQLDWKSIGQVTVDTSKIEQLLQKYGDVFREELGTMQNIKVELKVMKGAKPRFHRPRTMPFALKEAVERELKRLKSMGIIICKVTHSTWAAPIVPIVKADGSVRVSGDYKVTVNQSLDVDQYPLLKPEDLFAMVTNGRVFTKLDLSQAYQQMLFDEESRQYVTINTHLGLYLYTRLPFGVASAPAMFQKAMDMILQGLPGVIRYTDDILVLGTSEEEQLSRLEEVLKRLKNYG